MGFREIREFASPWLNAVSGGRQTVTLDRVDFLGCLWKDQKNLMDVNWGFCRKPWAERPYGTLL